MKLLLSVYFVLPAFILIGNSFGEYEKNILIIHSNHQNFEWTEELNRGLFEELKPSENHYFVQIEYLDYKRYQRKEIYEPIFELMMKKYRNILFDVVITADDGASDFYINHGIVGGILTYSYDQGIADNGIGISDEYLGSIFEPFTQEQQGYTRQFEGNGLGMALVKKYCELNNAKIEIESEKNIGTKITIVVKKK